MVRIRRLKMHNLGTVIRFEVVRTLKKKTFWLMALSFPVMIGAIFGIIYFSNKATTEAAEDLQGQSFSVAVTDKSGVVNPELLVALGAQDVADKREGEAKVQAGSVDAYIYIPEDVSTQAVELFAQDVGIFEDSRYGALATTLLSESVAPSVDANRTTIIRGNINIVPTYYRDGEVYDPIQHLIAPGLFLVLLYAIIVIFGNQMLVSTTEEKENRVIEMILTMVEARTLVTGKIISLALLGLVQAATIVIPVIGGYVLFHDDLALPSIDLSSIPLDWYRIAAGAVLFTVSFLLFTGLLVTIGAATPTAKEANGFFGVIAILLFGPLYAAPLFVSSPDQPFVQFLSYFPLTAPIPLLLRNAVGNLEWWEFAVSISILILTTVIIIALAVRVFQYGALEYSRRLRLKDIFHR